MPILKAFFLFVILDISHTLELHKCLWRDVFTLSSKKRRQNEPFQLRTFTAYARKDIIKNATK